MRRSCKVSMLTAIAGLCLGSGGHALHAALITPASGAGYLQDRPWDAPPAEYDEVSRLGFHDGVEGARKDFGNHRSPDPHNREEFRHPHVKDRDKDAYRSAFERGYQVGWDHVQQERR